MTRITDRLDRLRDRIRAACARAGRPSDSVTLVGVGKGHGVPDLREALAGGLEHLGENYLQEALPKIAGLRGQATWHFIGGVQSNKTRDLAAHFDWVQTVASPRVAERLATRRGHYQPPLQVCIQVRQGLPEERSGCPAEQVNGLADAIGALPRLRLRGLMMIPEAGLDEQGARRAFAATRRLLGELRDRGHAVDTLSMGMSADLEIAIEEGSTMVRIGTALFGPRETRTKG